MHQLSVCLLALALSSASVEAQISLGRCPYQPVVEGFDTALFEGDWYEYSKYLSPGQVVTRCTKIMYSADGDLIDVEVEAITLGLTKSSKGQIKKADPTSDEAKFTISWFEDAFAGRENDKTRVNYQVLATDYVNYAVIYNCVDLFLSSITELYVYTRRRIPNQNGINGVIDALKERRINTLLLAKTNQENCDN